MAQQAALPAAHCQQLSPRLLVRPRTRQASVCVTRSSRARRHGRQRNPAATAAAVPAAAAAAVVWAPAALAALPITELAAAMDEAPAWTLDQAVGLVFGALLLLLYLSSTQVGLAGVGCMVLRCEQLGQEHRPI